MICVLHEASLSYVSKKDEISALQVLDDNFLSSQQLVT